MDTKRKRSPTSPASKSPSSNSPSHKKVKYDDTDIKMLNAQTEIHNLSKIINEYLTFPTPTKPVNDGIRSDLGFKYKISELRKTILGLQKTIIDTQKTVIDTQKELIKTIDEMMTFD